MKHEVFNSLEKLYYENKLSHLFLIETNDIDSCIDDCYSLIDCLERDNNLTELIASRSLPSILEIHKDGKNIKKESIDNIKNTFSKKPIYSTNNYYIISEPETMNDTAFNKMLKFMEEPEDNIFGFLITNNVNFIPDTIFSRCQLKRVFYTNIKNDNKKYEKQIIDLLTYLSSGNCDVVWYNENVIFKELTERLDYIVFFKETLCFLLNKLRSNNTDAILLKQIKLVRDYIEKLSFNVNTVLLFNSFCIEMVDLYVK